MAYLKMREDCRVLHQKPYGKLFWNSNYNLDLRHACKRRQFDDTLCEDLNEDCFWDLGMKNKLKGINGMQMELHKMMYHSVTACYVYVYIKCLSFQVVMVYIACVELPVRQNDSVENIPESEALVESSVVCQEVVIKQHVTVCSKHFKPSDTEVRDVSMQQTTDVEGRKFRNLSPNGLKWFNGAGNIPLHICRKLIHSAPTALTHLYNDIVHQTSLSAKDLTNCLFTFSMPRFRGPTYFDVLRNKIGQHQTELECLGSGLSGTDVKKNGSVKAKYKKDGTKNGKTDKTGHAKLYHERAAGGNVQVDYMNKAAFGTKPREFLPLKTGTHNLPGYKLPNWRLVILLLLCMVNLTYENPVRDKLQDIGTKRDVFHKFQLLKSEVCQNPEKNTECQRDNFLFGLKIELCNYTCGSSEMIKCMNSPYGMVFFCIPNGTSCPKGIGWQVEGIDGSGMVMIKESFCPEGYYQAERSKCHNACRNKHESLEIIPEGFKVMLKGNHIRPTLLMCDYKAGYFNAHNKSFVNYDDSFLGHLDFCTHINHSNPCFSGQMPLYNGTCVEPCRPGYERDETDFLCKQVSDVATSDKDTQLGQPSTSRTTVKPEPTTTDKGHEEGIDKGTGKDGKSENFDAFPWYLKALAIVVVIVIICAGVAIISLVIRTVCFPQNSQGKPTGTSCTYQAVSRECTNQSGSDLSTASCSEGGRSTTDESTVDGNETPDAAQGTTKIEISSSSESIKVAGGRSTTDESKVDVNETPDAAQGNKKMEISPSSESIKGNRKVVKKSTFNSGNTTINIEKVENLLLGDLDRKVPAVVEGARNIAGMMEDLTAEATSDETEMDIKDTDIIQSEQKTVIDQKGCDLAHPNQKQTGKPDVIGLGQKLIAGEEFAKSRNELLSQVTVDGFSELMKSVGALIYKDDVIGTVFRAGDCYVFTARHVVRKIIDVNLNGQYDFSRLETEDVSVNFNASVAKPACFAYRVCLEFYSNDPYLDFAVLRITNPVQLPKKMFLDKYNFERLQAIMLSGIGYGHPEQDSKCKKHLDPNCQIIFAIDDRITECRAWLEQNIIYYQNHVRQNGANPALVDNSYIDIDTLHNIFLDITMEHGGSGSPFLDNNGRVVGILTHGHPEFCFKLPKLIQLNFPKGKRFESVLRLDYIYNHIFERDPELAGKLFG